MGAFLQAWWPIFVLIHLPRILTLVATTAYTRAKGRLDHEIPDELPHTAGEWLDAQLARFGLTDVRTIVTDERAKLSLNAYYRDERIIQLTDETYFKRDPVYWAIAAHELGHARFRIARPLLGLVLYAASRIKAALTTVGLALGLGNMLYALPGVTHAAFVCLAIALGLHVSKLVEELIASVLAYGSLRRDSALTPRHLASARRVLVLAFMTYFAAFVAHVVLLAQWSVIERLTGIGRLVPTTLTPFGHAVAIAATAVGVLYAASRAVPLRPLPRPFARPLATLILITEMLWYIALPAMVWLLWDQRTDTTFAYSVLLALIPFARLIVGVFALPLALTFRYFRHIAKMLEGPGIEHSDVFHEARRDGVTKTLAGNAQIAELLARYKKRVTVFDFARAATKMLYIPLLVMYWLR